MKLLYYNWVDFEDPEKRGGGVSVYQKNLIDAAVAQGDDVTFLSSGLSYSIFFRRPFLRRVGRRNPHVAKFEIVNSPLLSPGHLSFRDDATSEPAVERLFADFLRRYGPFDVVHFNNLEGIPLSFVPLAKQHARHTRVIFSLHNYFPFCPQVNLWFQEKANCRDFCHGKKCVNCLPSAPDPARTRRLYRLQTLLQRLGISSQSRLYRCGQDLALPFLRALYRGAKRLGSILCARRSGAADEPTCILDEAAARHFASRRAAFVAVLNQSADHVLAVSERVAELAVRFGLHPDKVQTLYIGTKFANRPGPVPAPARDNGGPLSIAYLGYMRRDKGFYFLLQALEKMPRRLAERLRVTVAAKVTDPGAVDWLRRLAHKFAAVTVLDGYTHAALPQILSGIDLGIVPVLWEDNLPQVALEFVGSGVPVLTSNLGGAHELLTCPDLTFKAGSLLDFFAKLRNVVENRQLLQEALAGRRKLFSTNEHYQILKERYYSGRSEGGTARRLSA
jgi:glycosyltransferase involved in cell wall biosynthesis